MGCQVSHDGRLVAVGEDFPEGGDGGGVRVFDTVGCCLQLEMIQKKIEPPNLNPGILKALHPRELWIVSGQILKNTGSLVCSCLHDFRAWISGLDSFKPQAFHKPSHHDRN